MPHPLTHGIDSYFGEYAANRRRVASVLLAVSVALSLLFVTVGRKVTTRVLDNSAAFGFEGPTQWVERIRLEEMAAHESPGLFAATYLTAAARRGEQKVEHRSEHPQAEAQPKRAPGEDEDDVIAKARMLALQEPVVRSETMIYDRLVRPEYPEEARDHNLEGVVELVALVDTTGDVLQIQIVGGTREPLFEAAAAKAILACRYRPYRVTAQAERVWAAYRIAFTLY